MNAAMWLLGLAVLGVCCGCIGWTIRDESAEKDGTERCLDCLTRIARERRANEARERGELT